MASDGDRYRDDDPGPFPPAFYSWPREAQVSRVTMRYSRVGLIDEILSLSGLPPDDEISKDKKMTKDELAAVMLALKGISYDRE